MTVRRVHVYQNGKLVAVEEEQISDEEAAQLAVMERKRAALSVLKQRAAKRFSSAEVPTVVKEIVDFLALLDT